MELQIFPRQNSKINVSIENDTPHISVNLKLHADIMTLDKDVEYETNEVLSKISNTTNATSNSSPTYSKQKAYSTLADTTHHTSGSNVLTACHHGNSSTSSSTKSM